MGAKTLLEKIKKKGGSTLVGVPQNLVDIIWGDMRPARPSEKVKVLNIEFAGKKFEEKIDDLRKETDKKKCAGFVVCRYICNSCRDLFLATANRSREYSHVGRNCLAIQFAGK